MGMDCVQCEEGPEILYEIRVIVTSSPSVLREMSLLALLSW